MFHIYEGFHLVDAYHKMRHQRKYHPEDSTKRVLKIALVAIVTYSSVSSLSLPLPR